MLPLARILFALVFLVVLRLPDANAGDPSSAVLADACATCHTPGGDVDGPVPSLSDLDAETLQGLLLGFRRDEIEATIMDRIAKGLTEAEIESLSRQIAAFSR